MRNARYKRRPFKRWMHFRPSDSKHRVDRFFPVAAQRAHDEMLMETLRRMAGALSGTWGARLSTGREVRS